MLGALMALLKRWTKASRTIQPAAPTPTGWRASRGRAANQPGWPPPHPLIAPIAQLRELRLPGREH
jgi:hypothetical protein